MPISIDLRTRTRALTAMPAGLGIAAAAAIIALISISVSPSRATTDPQANDTPPVEPPLERFYYTPIMNHRLIHRLIDRYEEDTYSLGDLSIADLQPDHLDRLVELTRSPDQWVRLHTVGLFKTMRVDAVAVLPRITQLLNDPNTQVVWTAIDCLGNIGPDASVAIPQLMVFMKTTTGTDYSRVIHSATALGKLGPQAKGAIPYIISQVEKEGYHADSFISAVGHFGPLARDAIPYLTRRLDDAQWTYSVKSAPRQAAWALGEMGKHAQPAMPTLLRIVEITNGDDEHFLLRAYPRNA